MLSLFCILVSWRHHQEHIFMGIDKLHATRTVFNLSEFLMAGKSVTDLYSSPWCGINCQENCVQQWRWRAVWKVHISDILLGCKISMLQNISAVLEGGQFESVWSDPTINTVTWSFKMQTQTKITLRDPDFITVYLTKETEIICAA